MLFLKPSLEVIKIMHRVHLLVLTVLIGAFLSGCSKSDSGVVVPQTESGNQPAIGDLSVENVHHALLGLGTVTYDPETNTGTYTPNREALMHLNVEPYLLGYCSNPSGCIRVGNFRQSSGGNVLIDVTIEHPMPSDAYSVFDLRVIAMMDVDTMYFPAFGVNVSQSMLNPDGFTAMWDNPGIPGNLNPFKAFNRSVDRRKFAAGTTSMETVEIKFPDGPFIVDVGVDASWAPKEGQNFPPEANSSEAYELTTFRAGSLTPSGGSLTFQANVKDHQGYTTIDSVELDCNGVFAGPVLMDFLSGNGINASYRATISNTLGSPAGVYDVLIRVRDIEDSSNPLDLSIYRVEKVVVGSPGGTASIQILEPYEDVCQYINEGAGISGKREIEITAISIPPGAGVSVEWYFTDPDEPESPPAADETEWYETDFDKFDNHGTGAGFYDGTIKATLTTVTDATGKTTVKFWTSTYGGDNYYVWAKRTSTQENASSPLITVWRKYLIRNDNMKSSGGTPGYYRPNVSTVNSESYEQCYMVLDIYDGPVQTIPYASSLDFVSGTQIVNWCRTNTGFYSATDTYQVVGVYALSGYIVGVAVPPNPHCLVASGQLDASQQSEVTAHEVGHLFGMNHIGSHSLMYPAVDGYTRMIRGQIDLLRIDPPLQPN
ncbi:hypothetical protein KKB99_06830 [bacterium]|nr:hypothetical protein [bacterium]MBU1025705.1 hypothetical protein [bacterium]